MAGFGTLDDVTAWAQVKAPDLAIFLTAYGAEGGDGLRGVGADPLADFDALVDTLLNADGSVSES